MSFATVVFGTAIITGPEYMAPRIEDLTVSPCPAVVIQALPGPGATFTVGSSIPSGGLRLFIVPRANLGNSPIDIGFNYVNQFGVAKTTVVSTSIWANTTSGTHIQVVLNAGDTGVRAVTGISYLAGGTAGDQLSFESWNEGIGRPPIPITNTEPFDRTAPGAHIVEPYLGLWKGRFYSTLYNIDGSPSPLVPIMYYQNPQIPIPVTFSRSAITAWIPEPVLRIVTSRLINLADNINARKEIVSWIPEPLSRNDYPGRMFFVFRSWIESVVGQVLSGYVQNVSGQIIKNTFSMVLISTTPTETSPGGSSTTADVNPDTGLYQAFLKKVVYDSRYLIVKVGLKNVALQGAGTPTLVDGNQQLPLPYNLQFACPVKNCDFTVTRKVV